MKINKKLRKAFTLVELVVVIAIIAILSTVSVVTYFGITNSAKKSVDDQTITQWNQLLLLEEELGNKSETPQEALDIILENGWDVAKLTPTYEGNEILWDQEENRFLILDKDTVTNSRVRNAYESSRKGEYWRFLKDYSEPKGYSVYITDPEFKVSETLIVTAGIDLSRVTEKVDVKYENVSKDQKVILNTNGGTLEVSDANVEVKHFGTASKSTVSSKSYEEKGTVVGDTLVNGGKYIATSSEAEAGTVLVSSKDVELNISASAKVGTVAGTTDEAQAAIKSNTNIPSDKKLDSDTAVVPTTDFAGGLGTENSPYLIDNNQQFINISLYSNEMKNGKNVSFKLSSDIDLSNISFETKYISDYFCGKFDGDNHVVITNDKLDGILGSAVNNTTIKNVKYKLFTNSVLFIAGSYYQTNVNLTLDNLDIYTVNENDSVIIGQNQGLYFNAIGLDNINNKWCDNHRTNLIIQNCNGYANLIGDSYNGVFIGGMLNNADVFVKNSNYYGQYYGEYTNLVYGNTCSDSAWSYYVNSTMTIQNVHNYGAIYGTVRAGLIAGGATSNEASAHTVIENSSIGTTRRLYDKNLSVKVDTNDKYVTVTKSEISAEYYVLTLVGGERIISETQVNSSYRFNIKLNNISFDDNGEFKTSYKLGKMVTVEQYKEIDSEAVFEKGTGQLLDEKGAELWITENNGEMYYVFSFEDSSYYFNTSHNVKGPSQITKALITIYDSEGKPIAQSTTK